MLHCHYLNISHLTKQAYSLFIVVFAETRRSKHHKTITLEEKDDLDRRFIIVQL
ncbi:hypothetical protein LCGC14_0733270 [marine sediment metagenome]|uniref:Uncharacterized protein n=1 Tax=marine sediment metagenome TaxID=412755 RepID=A0A0F9QTU4_9ZZZZ